MDLTYSQKGGTSYLKIADFGPKFFTEMDGFCLSGAIVCQFGLGPAICVTADGFDKRGGVHFCENLLFLIVAKTVFRVER